jgi:anaerobic selenocysteine-containing dehydrogenase
MKVPDVVSNGGVKPFSVIQGGSLEQSVHGVDMIRALSILVAVTGNFDVRGGNFHGQMAPLGSLRIEERISAEPAVTGARYPFYTRFAYEPSGVDLPSVILNEDLYPLRALLIQGANLVLTFPNAVRVREALGKLELLVVMDLFMTETAKLAHIFLPAASFLERRNIIDYGYFSEGVLALRDQAIDPVGESWPDWKIWSELGRRLGYGEYFPWGSDEEVLEEILRPSGMSLQQLRDNPGGLVYKGQEYLRYERDGFQTPSGKVEIYSEALERFGYHGLPTYWESYRRSERYPLVLTTRARILAYHQTQLHQVETFRKHAPEPVVEINPDTARRLGIEEKDRVRVESLQGSIEAKAVLRDIHPEVIVMAHGWNEANVNLLTSDTERDPVSGFPGMCTVPARIEKIC